MATVTVYNDDAHGRAIRIVTVNPFAATISEAKIMEATAPGSGHGGSPESFEVRNGTMLIITTAEKDDGKMPDV
jgi:hypothetical protein